MSASALLPFVHWTSALHCCRFLAHFSSGYTIIPYHILGAFWRPPRTAPFWVITPRVVVIFYRRFGTNYRSPSSGCKNPRKKACSPNTISYCNIAYCTKFIAAYSKVKFLVYRIIRCMYSMTHNKLLFLYRLFSGLSPYCLWACDWISCNIMLHIQCVCVFIYRVFHDLWT